MTIDELRPARPPRPSRPYRRLPLLSIYHNNNGESDSEEEKHVEILFFVAVSKNVFASKTEQLSRFFFVLGPWCNLVGVRTEKT